MRVRVFFVVISFSHSPYHTALQGALHVCGRAPSREDSAGAREGAACRAVRSVQDFTGKQPPCKLQAASMSRTAHTFMNTSVLVRSDAQWSKGGHGATA